MPDSVPSILKKIIRRKEERLEQVKALHSIEELKTRIRDRDPAISLIDALGGRRRVNIIAEIKQRSPSKGLICENFDVEKIFRAYELGGADAFSVLTEEDFFGGSLSYISRIGQSLIPYTIKFIPTSYK